MASMLDLLRNPLDLLRNPSVKFAVATVYALVLGIGVWTFYRDIKSRQTKASEEIARDIKELKEGLAGPDAREQLRDELLKTPFNRQYLFLDAKQIDEQYSKTGGQAILTSSEVEYEQALKSSGKAGYSEFIKTEVGESTARKVRERFETVPKSVSTKYEELEQLAIRKDLAAFGIESLQVSAEGLERFDTITNELQKKFGFPLDSKTVADQRRRLAEEAIPQLVSSLHAGPQSALIRGRFSAQRSQDGTVESFVFDHPMNQRFGLRRKLIVTFDLPVKDMEDAWKWRLEKADLELAVFGALLERFSGDEYRWEIIPLGVYLR